MALPQNLANSTRKWILRGIHDLPSLSDVVTKTLEATERESTSAGEIERLVSSDAALSAKILRVVNSAYYGLSGQVSSLNQAVVILGIQQIRNLVLSISALSLLKGRTPELRRLQQCFWTHSFATAVCAQIIARRKRFSTKDAEFVYTAGLLHDIGRLYLFSAVSEEYLAVIRHASKKGRSIDETEMELLGVRHDEIGGELADVWHFPNALAALIRNHEGPFGDDIEPLQFAVHGADRLTASHYSSELNVALPAIDLEVECWLGFSEEDTLAVLAETEAKVEEASEVYGLIVE